MSNTSKSWITPTYQTNLNMAIQRVILALDEYNLIAAWYALRTLYVFCPKKVKETLSKDFLAAQKGLDNVLLKRGVDMVTDHGIKQRGVDDFLTKNVWGLFEKTKDLLEEKGYLETSGAKPRYEGEPSL